MPTEDNQEYFNKKGIVSFSETQLGIVPGGHGKGFRAGSGEFMSKNGTQVLVFERGEKRKMARNKGYYEDLRIKVRIGIKIELRRSQVLMGGR